MVVVDVLAIGVVRLFYKCTPWIHHENLLNQFQRISRWWYLISLQGIIGVVIHKIQWRVRRLKSTMILLQATHFFSQLFSTLFWMFRHGDDSLAVADGVAAVPY